MTFSWTPPARPTWVQRFNDHARYAGGAPMISLEPDELLSTAQTTTGLADFGEDDWRTHFDVFMDALQKECPLHLLGRMMTRTDLLRSLENRLLLTDLWQQQPAILDDPVTEPLFIVGAARSGTSILHELLSLDADHAEPTTWKVHHPSVAAIGGPEAVAEARHGADAVVRFWHDVQPEYEAMHHNHGDLPTECIFMTLPVFLSDNWAGTHTVPTYSLHLATADHTPAYRWHRRVLQTLQLRERSPRWVLKAPSHLATLRQLFAVYPDARVIQLHRDPARTLPSMFDLMGTLKWMRSDRVDLEPFIAPATTGIAHLQNRVISDRRAGTLPDERFHDLRYADLLGDPVAAIAGAYEQFGWTFGNELADAIRNYIDHKPKGAKGAHHYALADFGLTVDMVHEHFAPYLEHFDIPSES